MQDGPVPARCDAPNRQSLADETASHSRSSSSSLIRPGQNEQDGAGRGKSMGHTAHSPDMPRADRLQVHLSTHVAAPSELGTALVQRQPVRVGSLKSAVGRWREYLMQHRPTDLCREPQHRSFAYLDLSSILIISSCSRIPDSNRRLPGLSICPPVLPCLSHLQDSHLFPGAGRRRSCFLQPSLCRQHHNRYRRPDLPPFQRPRSAPCPSTCPYHPRVALCTPRGEVLDRVCPHITCLPVRLSAPQLRLEQ